MRGIGPPPLRYLGTRKFDYSLSIPTRLPGSHRHVHDLLRRADASSQPPHMGGDREPVESSICRWPDTPIQRNGSTGRFQCVGGFPRCRRVARVGRLRRKECSRVRGAINAYPENQRHPDSSLCPEDTHEFQVFPVILDAPTSAHDPDAHTRHPQ